MTTVQAIRIHQFGGPEVLRLEEMPVGEPGPGELRIRHHACGLNYIDVYHRTGQYPNPLPVVPGVEGAGIVEAVGEGVTHLKPGDRAAYVAPMPGAYCQARVMPARHVVALPEGIGFDTAAGMMLKGLTVQYLLKQTLPPGGLQAGDHVLFHAAAGGVGLIACQWARALGLQLIGTAGSEEKCRLALEHGAAHAIDYRREDFVERVKEITGGRGVKVVYDAVGRDTFDRSLDCLRPLGLMVLFGSSSGPVPPLDLSRLAGKGSLYVTRPTVFTHLSTQEKTLAMAQDLFSVVLRGQVQIQIGQRYPLAEAERAHRDLESRRTTGSNILLP
jgi:NADPH2:quinone reductase